MNAEIIAIGTELLLGEIVDTNSAEMARALREIGVDLFFQTTVGDNQQRAATAIKVALERADVVITTGGLGPTVDDVTREAVAQATGRRLIEDPELVTQIAARFGRWGGKMEENNRRQALIPAGGIVMENPVGTAPCFAVETEWGIVISVPGVPREMSYMLEHAVIPFVRERMASPAVIKARVLRTAGIGESQVDALIQDLERQANPTVGLAAHAGQTDIRITAKAASIAEANEMINRIASEIRERLGDSVYGEGQDTVEAILVGKLKGTGQKLALIEVGTGGLASERVQKVDPGHESVVVLATVNGWHELAGMIELVDGEQTLHDRVLHAAREARLSAGVELALAIITEQDDDGKPIFGIALATPTKCKGWARGYGGPPEHVVKVASTYGFDRVRRWLLDTGIRP